MSILALSAAKPQVRITWAQEDALLQQHLDAAEGYVARHLNRNVYADQTALDAAIAAVPAVLAASQTSYDTASDAWDAADQDTLAAQLAWKKAQRDYATAGRDAARVYGGMIANAQTTQATLLLFGSFANNREAEMTDSTVKSVMLQLGVEALLEPYRIDEGV